MVNGMPTITYCRMNAYLPFAVYGIRNGPFEREHTQRHPNTAGADRRTDGQTNNVHDKPFFRCVLTAPVSGDLVAQPQHRQYSGPDCFCAEGPARTDFSQHK